MDIKEVLKRAFEAGNSYSLLPEDDWDIIKRDFEEWYENEGEELVSIFRENENKY